MNRALLVLGATGLIGRTVVAAAVEASVPVVAVARDAVRLEALRVSFPDADIRLVANTIVDDVAGDRLARELRESGRPLAGVVAALCGSAGRGRLIDQPASRLGQELDSVLRPHLAAARHLLPLLAEHHFAGNYVLIGGPGSETPWAGYGPRSVAAAALRMLARVLHDEARALGLRVQLLDIDAPACTDENLSHACPRWPRAEDIGRTALQLALRNGTPPGTDSVVPLASHPTPRPAPSPLLAVARPSAPVRYPDPRPPVDPRRASADARRLIDTLLPTNRNEVP